MDVEIDGKLVTISDEVFGYFNELTELQKQICLNKLKGMNNRDAYRNSALYNISVENINKPKDKNLDAIVCRMLKITKVRRFLDAMDIYRLVPGIMSRDEMALRLTMIARTDVSDVINFVTPGEELMNTETGELISGQTYWSLKKVSEMNHAGLSAISEMTAGKDGLKVKLESKRDAMKQLAELMGYNKPIKIDHNVGVSLATFYESLPECASAASCEPNEDEDE